MAKKDRQENTGIARRTIAKAVGFLREGWFWILLPTAVAFIIILLITLFADPYTKGTLPGKYIFLYALFGK